MNDIIVDTEVHLLHPTARQPNFKQESDEPVRSAIHEHEEFPLLEGHLSVDALLDSMEENGIDHCLLMGLPWNDPEVHADNNDFVESVVASYPGRFRGMYIPHLGDPPAAASKIEALDRDRFLGVKLIPGWQDTTIDDPRLDPIVDVVEARDLFLMVHTDHPTQSLDGDVPYRLLSFLQDHPDVKVLAPHLGGLLCLYALDDRIGPVLANTHFITSVSSTMQMVKYAADVNPDNVIFGTDFPFNHCHDQRRPIQDLRSLHLSPSAESKIFGQTALELFHCDEW